MLDGLRQFIADIVSPDAQDRAFDETDYRLAATALLVHVVSLDGEPSAIEKRKLHSLIESRFTDPGAADRLIASAMRVEGEAVDLFHFTSVIMRSASTSSTGWRRSRRACPRAPGVLPTRQCDTPAPGPSRQATRSLQMTKL
jgi:uncharacterized tellurite resistance protein B-like protein